eukprot:6185588-Pleurochrysis_carterae.AAC.1
MFCISAQWRVARCLQPETESNTVPTSANGVAAYYLSPVNGIVGLPGRVLGPGELKLMHAVVSASLSALLSWRIQ